MDNVDNLIKLAIVIDKMNSDEKSDILYNINNKYYNISKEYRKYKMIAYFINFNDVYIELRS